jgi:hypothetical protein
LRASAPDVVGNLRIDQAWGLLQISAVAHEVSGSYDIQNTTAAPAGAVGAATAAPNSFSEISGHPDPKWGGSMMAALQIKNIPTGAGDDIKVDATWAKGDTKNVISTSGASPSFAIHLDQKFSGIATLGPTAPKPATVYEFKDQDTVSFNVRAQRNF